MRTAALILRIELHHRIRPRLRLLLLALRVDRERGVVVFEVDVPPTVGVGVSGLLEGYAVLVVGAPVQDQGLSEALILG